MQGPIIVGQVDMTSLDIVKGPRICKGFVFKCNFGFVSIMDVRIYFFGNVQKIQYLHVLIEKEILC